VRNGCGRCPPRPRRCLAATAAERVAGRYGDALSAAGARAADVLDDEGGVVPDPADQRGAAGVLVLHAEEVRAGYAAPVDRRALRVEDGGMDPRVVGTETRCPDDRFDVELASVLEADRALAGAGVRGRRSTPCRLELSRAGADQQVASLECARASWPGHGHYDGAIRACPARPLLSGPEQVS